MGLDMFLERTVPVAHLSLRVSVDEDGWPLIPIPHLPKFPEARGLETPRVSMVVVQEVYWRKAYGVHDWFVHNVQGGIDDCGKHLITRATLQELLHLCRKALEYEDPVVLPQRDGESMEWHWGDLRDTIKSLSRVLSEWDPHADYHYTSSW